MSRSMLSRWPARRCVSMLVLMASVIALMPAPAIRADHTPPPEKVTIPGTLQSELGCAGDWQPDCDKTALTYDPEDDVWQGAFEVRPGDDQDQRGPRYKVALNGSWAENYGAKAQQNGSDIPLVVSQPTVVKFYYDHKTHWVADNYNTLIVTAMGNFQAQLGCSTDNDPGCLRSWLQDPEGDGLYAFVTTRLRAGTYEVKVAIDESLDETYGADSRPGGAAAPFTVKNDGDEIYFGFEAATKQLAISTEGAPRGNLASAQAHWVTRAAVLWNVVGSPKYTYALHYDPTGAMTLGPNGIVGGQEIPLTYERGGPGEGVFQKFPHLAGYTTLKLNETDLAKVADILKGQIAVTARNQDGRLVDATALQIPGVLDDLYTYAGPLGVTFEGEVPTLRVWAPTARSVKLHLFVNSTATADTAVPMTLDAASGVWSVAGDASWKGRFYLYEVEVYVRTTGRVEHNLVTDPYSLSLSMNSARSQIVDLNDPALMPPGWQDVSKPPLDAPEDSVIYELHVRDFSIYDRTVPDTERGTFKAFTRLDSNGMAHLKALAEAGLTHVHLLPAFDIATINENKAERQEPAVAQLASFPGDSDQQQALIEPLRDRDGFNWGYDPYHYTVPEGSYSTDPDSPARIREFREMVQALNGIGLRVVMDVVYNHTNASGQSPKSVLDKIVPGYYHRLNSIGEVETSTCCQNTASEHAMMEKLMIDSVVTWATAYQVDGFRFDLMGHHMLSNMVNVRAALDALTPGQDGVDGSKVYVYGEGWNFGEVANDARGKNATQLNIGGTGLGVFNDRLRDGARGGGPFNPLPEQGYTTGLFGMPNAYEKRSADEQKAKLLEYMDWIRIGLAGNLRDYQLVSAVGNTARGEQVKYNGAPAGYTLDPQENVNYVSAHDNETLFDAVQAKAPAEMMLAERIRMNNMGISLALLGQGVPFFHAGDDMLRSKSLDRNSYNSGDWFNRLDFTFESNNWAVGLPPAGDNRDKWPIIQPLLADPKLKPAKADILGAVAHFQEMLKIRRSSMLFRLRSAEDVQKRLAFFNIGPNQTPGLIVMRLLNTGAERIDDPFDQIVVLFNASKDAVTFTDDAFAGAALELHPLQSASQDPIVKTAKFDSAAGRFDMPARTTAVFVAKAAPALAATAASSPTAIAQPTTAAQPPATESPASLPLILAGIAGMLAVVIAALALRRRSG